VATNSAGDVYIADTNNHTIRLAVVPVAPAITTQPQSQTVNAGTSVTLTVATTGKPAPTYQWMLNGGTINGATSSTFVLNNVQSANAGSYSVSVTNSSGVIGSNTAMLTVNPVSSPPSGDSGGNGGGGGGAPSYWFFGALGLLALAAGAKRWPAADRRMLRRK
jgi:hypothetical protein